MRDRPPRSPRVLVSMAACALAAFLGACASETTSGLILRPGESATVTVHGGNPYAVVRNRGPGWLEPVRWTFGGGVVEAGKIGPGAAVGRTMRAGGTIEITAAGERADVHISARRASGMSIEAPTQREAQRERPPAE